jgi:hypothetical protein
MLFCAACSCDRVPTGAISAFRAIGLAPFAQVKTDAATVDAILRSPRQPYTGTSISPGTHFLFDATAIVNREEEFAETSLPEALRREGMQDVSGPKDNGGYGELIVGGLVYRLLARDSRYSYQIAAVPNRFGGPRRVLVLSVAKDPKRLPTIGLLK